MIFQEADKMPGCAVGYVQHRGYRDRSVTLGRNGPPMAQDMTDEVQTFAVGHSQRRK